MKKILLLAMGLMTSISVFATDVWEGTHHVTWETTLNIEATKFEGIQAGNKIVFEVNNAEDVVEFHSEGKMLPGTRYCTWLNSETKSVEIFATPAMVAKLTTSGIEVCGGNFDITKVWFGDGKDNITENTVWTGYFWMDEWSTLEIASTCFDGINWDDVAAIRFYSEAGRTDYVINILASWEDGKLGDQSSMTMTADYAELSFNKTEWEAKTAGKDRLMIQCNKEGGNAFNFTSVELVKKNTTGIESIKTADSQTCYDLLGRVASKGLVIKNGHVVLAK